MPHFGDSFRKTAKSIVKECPVDCNLGLGGPGPSCSKVEKRYPPDELLSSISGSVVTNQTALSAGY